MRKRPYKVQDNGQVKVEPLKGYPHGTPTTYAKLTQQCLNPEPSKRPSFDRIRVELEGVYTELVDADPPPG